MGRYLERVRNLEHKLAPPGSISPVGPHPPDWAVGLGKRGYERNEIDERAPVQEGRLAAQDGRPLAFPGEGPGDRELAEIEQRVKTEGCVLCWSELLQDFLAVHADGVDPSTMAPGFVPYGDTEFRHLFGDDKPALSPRALLRIHAAKKTGASVTGNRPHQRKGPETP